MLRGSYFNYPHFTDEENSTFSPKCYEVVILISQMKKQAPRNEVTSQGQTGAWVEHLDQRPVGDH